MGYFGEQEMVENAVERLSPAFWDYVGGGGSGRISAADVE